MKVSIPNYISGKGPRDFSFPRGRAVRATQRPDRVEDIAFESDRIFIRLYVRDGDGYSDVVGVAQNAEEGCAHFAFRAFDDLTDTPPKQLSPRQIVAALANRFGTEIELGEKRSKCFLGETIPGDPAPDFELPSHGRYYFPVLTKENRAGDLDIWAVFCLDLKAYGDWANSH